MVRVPDRAERLPCGPAQSTLAGMDERAAALSAAYAAATDHLASVDTLPVWPRATAEQLRAVLGGPLPEVGEDAAAVITALARDAAPGLAAIPGGRFFGFVTGGELPAALAADWLVSAWDQNAGPGAAAPAAAAIEQVAGEWVCSLLGLPVTAGVGFTTGAQTSNFVCLAAAQHALLRRSGWDLSQRGLRGAPPLRLVVGADRHGSIDRAARMCGIGRDELVVVDSDAEGRMLPEALAPVLAAGDGAPTVVCLQAGEVHTGAFDAFAALVPMAREHGAWVHIDGAFGLWAAASSSLGHLTAGMEGADSWTTDAHKTLNVPYDCAMAIIRDPADAQAMFRPGGDYLVFTGWDPWDATPELSRRARGVPVWAALRSLGATGVAELVERLCARAQRLAAGLRRIPGVTVINDVGYTQVLFRLAADEQTQALGAAILAEGTAALTGARWRDRAVLRCSVSSWRTSEEDVDATLDAIERLVSAQSAKSNP